MEQKNFLVTARKWRPQRFDEVVGQEHITATLKNALKTGRIAHAYLFTGPRGVGKTTSARILAKVLNCINPQDFEPCNECEMCLSIQNFQSLDIIEIDGASNRGIDEVRQLRESARYGPTKGKYKVYIIDEVHSLTKDSFNAFLKTLEEPPANVIFIFATTDVHKVPSTIISRCQRYDFRRIQLNTIKELLSHISKEEGITIDDKTLTIIGRKADGALRDAESIFDQVVSFCGNNVDSETVAKMLNLIDDNIYFEISDAILNKKFNAAFEASNTIYENGWNIIDFMSGLLNHFRNILFVITTKKTDSLETAEVFKEKYLKYVDTYSQGDLLRILNFLVKTENELRFSQNQKLKIEIALNHLIGFEKTELLSNILSEIKEGTQNYSTVQEPKKETYVNHSIAETKIVERKPLTTRKPLIKKNDLIENNEQNNQINNDENNFSKWNQFCELINSEKKITLGLFISNCRFAGLTNNKLIIEGTSENIESLIPFTDYLVKKGIEAFGKKLEFDFQIDETISRNETKIKEEININIDEKYQPLIDTIVKELGGEEVQ